VDELRKENERSRDAARDLEVKIAALRDSAKTEQRAADKTADQIRAERDTLQARLARLEQVSSPRRALSGGRRNAEAIPKVQAEKDALDVEVTGLNARLQEALGDLTSSRENDGQLRSQLLHLEDEARELKAKASRVEEEMSGLRHQLAQRTQEFESQSQKASATLAENIQTLEANLDRSSGDLNAAIQKA
jgi:chromosome segregation ATPase